jgi:hypothetical protein
MAVDGEQPEDADGAEMLSDEAAVLPERGDPSTTPMTTSFSPPRKPLNVWASN